MPEDALQADESSQPAKGVRAWAGRHRHVLNQLSIAASFVLLLASVMAVGTSYYPLLTRAEKIRAVPVRVEFEWPPLAGEDSSEPVTPGGQPRTWVLPEIRTCLERLVSTNLSDNPLDEVGLARAREALVLTGWFKDDLRLVRHADGLVAVTGTWRFPVAAVRANGQDQLVASGGELLPLAYRPGESGMKVIVGVPFDPPAPGHPWLGGEVQESIKLLRYLQTIRAGYEQIAGIDASEVHSKNQLTIVTEQGNRILWGGPVDTFNPGQAKSEVKRQWLADLVRTHGRIDAGFPVIDVRTQAGVFVVDTTASAEANASSVAAR